MKVILLVVLSLWSPLLLRGQLNYISYHREILKAEQLFFLNKYDSSLTEYKRIFSKYPKAFAKDCFTALQFAAMRRDTSYASMFFTKGFQNGVNWESLNKSKHIRSLLQNNIAYGKRVRAVYEDERKRYLNSINRKLRDSIYSLLKADAKAKKALNLGNTKMRRNPRVVKDSFHRYHIYGEYILDTNLHVLKKLTSQYGYPGEHLIGLQDQELDGGLEPSHFLASITSLILFHHFCGFYLLETELFEALQNGELSPGEYALIYEWAYDGYYQSKGQLRGSNCIYHHQVQCEYTPQEKFFNNFLNDFHYCRDTVLVNHCRKEIGMQSLQHQMIKQRFASNNDLILKYGWFWLH